ncbi:MAG: FmdB family transcriptional regulator [Rhodocyclales bacterium CG_4_9_14_3_um_filter_68_10]|nr:MAG: FmdB family transcriptional regulator [Rhodocyclales bacterium CG_4_9_14_3_um_filter_68_10]
MPIYEYRCNACGFQKEYLRKRTDAPLTECPECGGATLEKMLSAGSFQLKGKGWYATDFKGCGKDPAKAGAKPETKAAPACGSGGCPACST